MFADRAYSRGLVASPDRVAIVDMHKDIGAAVMRQDEAKSAICVEEFDPSSWHF